VAIFLSKTISKRFNYFDLFYIYEGTIAKPDPGNRPAVILLYAQNEPVRPFSTGWEPGLVTLASN